MKKLLMVVGAILLVFVTAGRVSADRDYGSDAPLGKGYYGDDDYTEAPLTGDQKIIGFRSDWGDARDFGVKPIEVGDGEIKVKTYPGATIHVSIEENDTSGPAKNLYQLRYEDLKANGIKFTLADFSGIAVFDLTKAGYIEKDTSGSGYVYKKRKDEKAEVGDTYTITVSKDGFTLGSESWTVGLSIPRDVEEKRKQEDEKFHKQKEQEKLQKQLEDAMVKRIRAEDHKTWYQRLGDGIRDQWWNFTGMFY
ncbi:hypothetical protein [Streptococcus halichoeri]|uniref:hypothetical protein n=1 Tax=Streptococcus halichoeri TaxID=254785 RepID=UPI00135A87AF|nr:hypothetical protein [Streptococcus halichoeri]